MEIRDGRIVTLEFNSFFFPLFPRHCRGEQIKRYEKLETVEERRKLAREIYDNFIMKELLSHTHVMPEFSSCFFFPFRSVSPSLSFRRPRLFCQVISSPGRIVSLYFRPTQN